MSRRREELDPKREPFDWRRRMSPELRYKAHLAEAVHFLRLWAPVIELAHARDAADVKRISRWLRRDRKFRADFDKQARERHEKWKIERLNERRKATLRVVPKGTPDGK